MTKSLLLIFFTILLFSKSGQTQVDEYECNVKECIVWDAEGNWKSYYRGETEQFLDYEFKYFTKKRQKQWKIKRKSSEPKSEVEQQYDMKISLLNMLLDEGSITDKQYEELKFLLIASLLEIDSGTQNTNENKNTNNETNELLKEQLKELKKQSNIQGNEGTGRILCSIFNSVKGINKVFENCL